jgi:iron complex transport system substrate-binding protein
MLRSNPMKYLLLGLSSLLLLLACADSTRQSSVHGGEDSSAGSYPRTVETFGEQTLRIPRAPERILPANTATLELVAALGKLDQVIAVPAPAFAYANTELDPADWEGKTFERYLVEPMLALEPDLVLTNSWQNPETSTFLKDTGVTVLDLPTAQSLEDLLEAITVVGDVLEVPERAHELREELAARCERLRNTGRESRRVMTYSTFGTGGWTGGKGTTADLLITLAGLRNASSEHGLEGHAAIDIELLLTLDPDYILIGSSEEDPAWSATLEVIRNEPALESLRALREDRILVIPLKHYTSNSHYIIDAAEALAARIE